MKTIEKLMVSHKGNGTWEATFTGVDGDGVELLDAETLNIKAGSEEEALYLATEHWGL